MGADHQPLRPSGIGAHSCDRRFKPISLTLGANQAVQFHSQGLERGNPGVPASVFDEEGRSVASPPVQVYANEGAGGFTLATERFIAGGVPEVVFARKALIGDFHHDGQPDLLVADHRYDFPPYPGAHPVLLLSWEHRLRSAGGLELVVGYHHGAASGDIGSHGDRDIFLTHYRQVRFLQDDGSGASVRDRIAVPAELTGRGVHTTEIIDMDEDGYPELLVADHEYDDQPTAIYRGERSGGYDAPRKTLLPAVAGPGVVVDVDAGDLDEEGDRDIVRARTGSAPAFYAG